MACNPSVPLSLAACLLLVPGSALAAEDGALPGGSGEAFHARMLAWSAPAPAAAEPISEEPLPQARQAPLPHLSSRFGLRADPLHGGWRMHKGIDIPGPSGSAVLAADGGTVIFAGRAGSYGLMIELEHPGGLRTRYAHLSQLLVRSGSPVARQQAIGLIGRSTGSHLHFEVLRNGTEVDPIAYLGQSRPGGYFAPRPRPFIGETAPVHISRFARDRATQVESRQNLGGCHRPQGRVEVGCPD
jgi:murein DD-endopeptidase MepM/ murein hydrolase activator NlpD